MQYLILYVLSVIFYFVFCFKNFKAEDLHKIELECNYLEKKFDSNKESRKLNLKISAEIFLSSIMIVLCYYAFMSM